MDGQGIVASKLSLREVYAAPSSRPIRVLVASLAALAAFLVPVSAASAAKEPVNEFGGASGTAGAEFNNPRGIAVNQSGAGGVPAGTFYVADSSNQRVQQFSPVGAFVRAWGFGVADGAGQFQVCTTAVACAKGVAGNAAGALNNPQGIAVDQATGNVFVTNQSNRRVDIYTATGAFLGAFGWGARTGASELQFCTTGTGCSAPGPTAPTSGAVGGGQFGAQMGGVEIAPNGDIYVADKTSRRVQVFTLTDTGGIFTGVEFLRAFGWGAADGSPEFQVCTASPCNAPAATGTGLGQFGTNSPTDIAVDPSGNVFALDYPNKRVQRFDSTPAPVEASFGAAALESTFGTGNRLNVAIEPVTDNLLVSGARSTASNRIAVQELNGAGEAVALDGAELTVAPQTIGVAATGLDVASPALGGNIYVANGTSAAGHRVFVLNEAPTMESVTSVGPHGATFNGSVVSNGIQTTYHFEYSSDGGNSWTKSPVPDAVAGAEPGSIPVSHAATDLLPGTEYEVRLVANRPLGGGQTVSQTLKFTTATSTPTVEATFASSVGPDNATLAAYLDPENSETTYRFEYGTTESYGSFTPADPAPAGKGTGRVTVSAPVEGLAPGTTYHFRVVATNDHGTTTGPDVTFTTLPPAPALPGRAYEMVSPPEKHGSDVMMIRENHTNLYSGFDFAPLSSVDGNAVAFTSFGSFAGAPSHGVFTAYRALRSEDSWDTHSLALRMDGANTSSPVTFIKGFSPDLRSWVIEGPRFPQPLPEASEGVANSYLWDGDAGTYRLMTPGAPENSFMIGRLVGGSKDLKRAVLSISQGGPLTEETPPTVYEASTLYSWDAATGKLQYVGIEPGGSPFLGPIAPAEPAANGGASSMWNPVSEDGRTVYFYTGVPQQLYVRINGSQTQHVSASKATVPDPETKPAQFHWASGDGKIAFFSSPEQLTDDANTGPARAGNDLYRYRVDGEELTDITVLGGNGAEVQGVIGGSEDGKRLYFVAKGALAPGAVPGENNLYFWEDDGSAKGSIEFIAGGVGLANWGGVVDPFSRRHLGRVTPDGSRVLFQTTAQVTAYDNGGTYQVYVYDAVAGELRCVSCNPSGRPALHDALALGSGDAVQAARTITDDGRFVFFNTAEALVPEDVNGVEDAYVYDWRTGKVNLVSPGTGPYPATFVDASADGSDIFFGTRQQLVRIDSDDNIDIYDARVGGGLANQNPPLSAPCVGEACRQEPLAPPPAIEPASETFHSRGNVREPAAKKKKAAKRRAAKKKRAAKRKAVKRSRQATKRGRAKGSKAGHAYRNQHNRRAER